MAKEKKKEKKTSEVKKSGRPAKPWLDKIINKAKKKKEKK